MKKQMRSSPAQQLAAKRNWIMGNMRLAEETVRRMNETVSSLFADEVPVDDPQYSMAVLRLKQSLESIRSANRLLNSLFKDYAANGERRETRKELKYGKI